MSCIYLAMSLVHLEQVLYPVFEGLFGELVRDPCGGKNGVLAGPDLFSL